MIYLTSITKIKRGHEAFKAIDTYCLLSKKLRNRVIWMQREEWNNNKGYISFSKMLKNLAANDDVDYRALPAQVSQQTVMDVDDDFQSFFTRKERGEKCNAPSFSPKGEKGRFKVTFTNQSISLPSFRNGFIKPSGIDFEFPIPKYIPLKDIKDIREVRFTPKQHYYQMEIVYRVPTCEYQDTGNYAAVDIGISNFLTIVSNCSSPLLIKGGKFISTNSFWIKKRSKSQSKLKKGFYSSNKIKWLDEKRNNKIRNDINCLTNQLVSYFIGLQVSDVYIGWNTGIKHGINIGKSNNQKFVYLPHKRVIDNLSYKCERFGIKVHTANEAYTSKCSFIDDEEIGKHETYLGKRVTTKFFVSKEDKKINADVNAAYNILKLSRGIKFIELDPRQVFGTPRVLKVNYGLNRKRPSHEL